MIPRSVRRRAFRIVGMLLAVLFAVLLAPILIAKLFADARGAQR